MFMRLPWPGYQVTVIEINAEGLSHERFFQTTKTQRHKGFYCFFLCDVVP